MRRREFVTMLAGAVAAGPIASRAQQADRMRRIGVMMALSEADRGAKALLNEFKRGLAESGWTDGGNILMDVRWTGGDVDLIGKFAKELVTLNPDVILANSTPVTLALQRGTQTIPIVFAIVGDPLGSGLVGSLAHRRRRAAVPHGPKRQMTVALGRRSFRHSILFRVLACAALRWQRGPMPPGTARCNVADAQ